MHTKLLLLSFVLAITATAYADKKIICYYESWAKYRNGSGKYAIGLIDATKCTHVIYSFVGIQYNGDIKLLDDEADLWKFTNHVKRVGTKALVSIGGASESSAKFSDVFSTKYMRKKFVANALAFLSKYNFDGLDVDWEYPNQNGGKPADKENFVWLLRDLKNAFAGKGYILSAAVGAEASSASVSYNIAEISQYLDFINIMTYDFNGSWNDYTGLNAPIRASMMDSPFEKTLNVHSAVVYWRSQGAPAEKIIIGVPFYGITFTLQDPNNYGLYAKTTGPGFPGPFTNEPGTIGYNEMCMRLVNGGWTVIHDDQQGVPYAHKRSQWVSFDNIASVRQKAEYVKFHNLGGVMVWSMDTDDFGGHCHHGPYPLLSTLNQVLRN